MHTHELLFVDLETTGLDFERHEIVQLALVKTSSYRDGLVILSERVWKIRPTHIETANSVSLGVSGYVPDEWKDAVSLEDALREFAALTKGAMMVSHNVAYDFGFLWKAFQDTGIENTMHYHKLDTISIAYAKLNGESEPNQYALGALAARFHIPQPHAHDALADVHTMIALYKVLMNM